VKAGTEKLTPVAITAQDEGAEEVPSFDELGTPLAEMTKRGRKKAAPEKEPVTQAKPAVQKEAAVKKKAPAKEKTTTEKTPTAKTTPRKRTSKSVPAPTGSNENLSD